MVPFSPPTNGLCRVDTALEGHAPMLRTSLVLCPLFLLCLSTSAAATVYTVRSGDTLSSIAGCMLGDPERWPEIAKLNGIVEPYRLAVGQVLQLPMIVLQALKP